MLMSLYNTQTTTIHAIALISVVEYSLGISTDFYHLYIFLCRNYLDLSQEYKLFLYYHSMLQIMEG